MPFDGPTASAAYRSALEVIAAVEPRIAEATRAELADQRASLKLIASENYASPAVMAAQGSVLTNKYAEGYPGRRYYGGCEWVDVVETLAIDRAKALFGAEHANVQPHSGANANMAVFFATLKPGDTFLALDLADLEAVRAAAGEFLRREERLHVLFNNAGVGYPAAGSRSRQGFELQLGVNNLGTFLFTKLLTPTLARTARAEDPSSVRVVWVSSSAAESIQVPSGGPMQKVPGTRRKSEP